MWCAGSLFYYFILFYFCSSAKTVSYFQKLLRIDFAYKIENRTIVTEVLKMFIYHFIHKTYIICICQHVTKHHKIVPCEPRSTDTDLSLIWTQSQSFICLKLLCRPVRSTFAVRETASLGIMGAPWVPPLNPSETIVLSEHYCLWGI